MAVVRSWTVRARPGGSGGGGSGGEVVSPVPVSGRLAQHHASLGHHGSLVEIVLHSAHSPRHTAELGRVSKVWARRVLSP